MSRCVGVEMAGRAGWTNVMKKKSAYPLAAANPTGNQPLLVKLSGRIANRVTPKRVPAAKLINAQSGLCVNCNDVLIDPPARANT